MEITTNEKGVIILTHVFGSLTPCGPPGANKVLNLPPSQSLISLLVLTAITPVVEPKKIRLSVELYTSTIT